MNTQHRNSIEQIISVKEMNKIKQKMFRQFVISMTAVSVVLLFVAWYSYHWMANSALDKAVTQAKANIETAYSLQQNDFSFLKNIVFQLNTESELQRYVMDRNELSREFILDSWIKVAEQVHWISQIRYLSNTGYELLRVEYDRQRGFAQSSPSLQNQENSEYFLQAKDLSKGQLYISPVGLNKEYNEFSYPLTPVILFAMPMSQPLGQSAGVLVVNIFADKFLTMINEVMSTSVGQTLVLDQQGNFLQSYDKQQDWAHELTPQVNNKFRDIKPSVWLKMQQADSAIIKLDDERFVFQSLSDIENQGQINRYLLVQHITANDVKDQYASSVNNLLILIPALFLLAWLWVRSKIKDRLIIEVEHNSLELISALFYSKEAICITDDNWRIAAVNNAFCDSTGYSAEDVEGITCDQLYFIDDKDMLAAIRKDIVEQGFWLGEVQNQRKDGTESTNLMFASATAKQDGSTSHYVLQMIDITDRKRMENELKVAAAAFDTRSAITITDQQGNIIHANDAFTKITGYALEDVVGQNPRILSSGRHDQAFYQTLWQEIIDNGFWQGEIWNKHKNGKIYPEWITISSVKDDKGEVIYYVATFEDITERKRLEAEIEELKRQQGTQE